MLNGKDEEDFVPKELRAGLLQQKVEMIHRKEDWDAAVNKCIVELGFKVVQKTQHPWASTADILADLEGFSLVDIGTHWVAMGRRADTFYFFDPNEGFFSHDSKFEFRSDVNSIDNFGYYYAEGWMTNRFAFCICYRIDET